MGALASGEREREPAEPTPAQELLPMWSDHCLRITVAAQENPAEPVRPRSEARPQASGMASKVATGNVRWALNTSIGRSPLTVRQAPALAVAGFVVVPNAECITDVS